MATKKQKFDAVVSTLGTLLELAVNFSAKLKKKGLSLAEALVRLASNEKAQDEIVAVLARLVASQQAVKALWTVTSDGTTNAVVLEAMGRRRVSPWAKDVMSKPQFIVTRGQTYRLVIIRGDEFATDVERTTANIRTEAARRRYLTPPAEVVALLGKKFTQEELGFSYVVVMHEPILDSDGGPGLLVLYRDSDGEWLYAWDGGPVKQWFRGGVFVFLASPKASLFLSRSASGRFGRVLFLELSVPTAEHFTNCVYFDREGRILFSI